MTQIRPVDKIKCVIVGDGAVGKTCMLYVYAKNKFPEEYIPTIFDNYTCSLNIDKYPYQMELYDTAGQEEYDQLRPLSYPQTDVFIVCYAINNRNSYENVMHKWGPELKRLTKQVPIMLIATKKDMKDQCIAKNEDYITPEEALYLQKKLSAYAVLEVSALKNENISEAFKLSVTAALKTRLKLAKVKNNKCIVF